MNSLISPTKSGTKAMEQLGINIKDSHGKMKPFNKIMEEFHDKMKNLSKTDKIDVLHQIFGTTGQAAAAILTNSASSLSDFNKEVSQANKNDYIGKLSKKNMDNPVMQVQRLKQNFKQLEMSMSNAFSNQATSGLKTVNSLLEKLNQASPTRRRLVGAFAVGTPIIAGTAVVLGSVIRNMETIAKTAKRFHTSFHDKTKQQNRDIQRQIDLLLEENDVYSRLNGNTSKNSSAGISNIYSKGNNSSKNVKSSYSSERPIANTFSKSNSSLESSKTLGKGKGVLSRGIKLAGGGLGLLDVVQAGSDLVGMKRSTVGQSIGGAGGALGGAALGSVAGPLGTAVGGALGEKLGKSIGSSMQHEYNQKHAAEQKQSYNSSYHSGLKGDEDKSFNNLSMVSVYEKQLNSLKKPNKNSFNTKEQYNQALKTYNTEKEHLLSAVADLYSSEEKLLDNHIDNQNKKHQNGFNILQKKYGFSNAQIQAANQEFSNQQKNKLSDDIKALKNIQGKGDKASLKKKKAVEQDIVDILGTGSKEQKDVLSKLHNARGKMSDKQAGKLVATSFKSMKAQTKNAQKEFKKQSKLADSNYDDTKFALDRMLAAGQINKKQYTKDLKQAQDDHDNAIKNASAQKTAVTDSAQDEYKGAIYWAKQKTKDHLASVNEETGKVEGAMEKQSKAYAKAHQAEYGYKKSKSSDNIFTKVGTWWHNLTASSNKVAYKKGKESNERLKKGQWTVGWANGTPSSLTHNQRALVNEKGMESAYNPKTNRIRFFDNGPQIATLYKGEHVLNAKDTNKLIHGGLGKGKTLAGYKDGTGSLGDSSLNIYIKGVNSLSNFSKKSNKTWQQIEDDTNDKSNSIHDTTINTMKDMKNNVLKTFKDIDGGIVTETKNTVNGYNKAFSLLPKYTHNNMSDSIKQLNKGYSSINQSLNQFGSNSDVLKPIHYATGSNGAVAKEHMAIVNDARKGNQQEAIVRKDGIFLPKHRDALVNLKKGDAVLNGAQTKAFAEGTGLSHYKEGTGVSDNKLKELIEHNYSKTNEAFKNDFTDKSKLTNGAQLAKAMTNSNQKALGNDMEKWYKSIWKTLREATGEGGSAKAFLDYAKANYTGDKYQLGANGQNDMFDCSSMVEDALKHFGIQLGRTTTAMQGSSKLQKLGKDISNAKAGDLALFGHGDGANGHVGIVNSPSKGTMFNETPPYAGVTNISDVTSVPLDGYYRIKGLNKSSDKHSVLDDLAKKQLGKKRLNWVKQHLGDESFGGKIPKGDHAELLKKAGIPENEWSAYDYIISRESNWNSNARNPNGGAYGLPQSLPANKMASAGSDWRTNPVTQLKWMSKYVDKYGGIFGAQKYWSQHHNYENGGYVGSEQFAHIGEHGKPEMVLPLTNKSRSMQLIKQALSFMNGHENGGSNDGNKRVDKLEKDIDKLTKNNEKMVQLLSVIAEGMKQPVRAFVSEKELVGSINKNKQREQRNSAMRRGDIFG